MTEGKICAAKVVQRCVGSDCSAWRRGADFYTDVDSSAGRCALVEGMSSVDDYPDPAASTTSSTGQESDR